MSSSPISSSSSEPAVDAPAAHVPFAGMLDLVCHLDVLLGTGSITVRDCLKLQRLSVIRLEQSAGSDLQVQVHGMPTVSGEVVIVDDSTAIRVTAVTSPQGGGSRS
jgi:flagellar motor switch/type III secretory pathway protein FliN